MTTEKFFYYNFVLKQSEIWEGIGEQQQASKDTELLATSRRGLRGI